MAFRFLRSAQLGSTVVAVGLVLGAVTGCSATSDAGTTDDGSEIVTSNRTSIEDVPWTIALLDASNRPFCTGSLVAKDWILTSQHCVEKKAEGFKVAAGFEDLSDLFITERGSDGLIGGGSSEGKQLHDGELDGGQISTVDAIHRLAGYASPEKANDLALLHLATPFELGDRVAPIPLPTDLKEHALSTRGGASATVSGWGGAEDEGEGEGKEHKITSNLLTLGMHSGAQQDVDRLGRGITVSENQLWGAFGAKLLPADMGGPLTVYEGKDASGKEINFLAGIASWRIDKYSSMFESVVPHLAWIKSTIAEAK